jgi:hypothetical protein
MCPRLFIPVLDKTGLKVTQFTISGRRHPDVSKKRKTNI